MYYYIVNPAAGRGRFYKMGARLTAELGALGIQGETAKTTGLSDIKRLIEIALKGGYTTIIAVGGDHTINEITNHLARLNVVLGIIPTGGANSLARLFGIPNEREAPFILAQRRTETVSLAHLLTAQRTVIHSAVIGVEAELALQSKAATNRVMKAKALVTAALTLPPKKLPRFRAIIDGETELSGQFIALRIENGATARERFSGLYFSVVGPLGRKEFLRYLKNPLALRSRHITRVKAQTIDLETTPELPIVADGEVLGATPERFSATKETIRVIVGKQRAF